MTKPAVDAIYPLTFMQRSLLFHSLSQSYDQGLLHVQCSISGDLKIDAFENAWAQVCDRHEALRSSIHWEKIEKPVQVVRKNATPTVMLHDWKGLDKSQLDARIAAFIEEDRRSGLEFTSAPVSRLNIFEYDTDAYVLVWTCHHILLDGWSTAVVLNDVFALYDGMMSKSPVDLPVLATNKAYQSWISRQNKSSAKEYWQERLDGLPGKLLWFANTEGKAQGGVHQSNRRIVSSHLMRQLEGRLRSDRVTLGVFMQLAWGLVVQGFSGSNDIVFGKTTSGRNADVPNLDKMAGLFMGVIPVRIQCAPQDDFSAALKLLQKQQLQSQQFEYVGLDEIMTWSGTKHQSLFDSLVVIENFPWSEIQCQDIKVGGFKGGLTSTYPVTIVVVPGEELRIDLISDSSQINLSIVNFLLDKLVQVIELYVGQESLDVGAVLDEVTGGAPAQAAEADTLNVAEQKKYTQEDSETEYVAPRNQTELEIARIWETVFGRQPIGVTDNFFEIGGKSVMAVRLFALIEQRTGRNLPPVMLLKHPTIAELAKAMDGDATKSWASLVPFRASGSKPPLVCIHAGGGHVFFYNTLAKYLDAEQPVYSLQPRGLDGVADKHASIEEMAAHYIEEMIAACPKGPFVLLSICFGNPTCIEIARQLEAMGREVSQILIIDSAPSVLGTEAQPGVATTVNRYKEILKAGDFSKLIGRVPVVINGVRKKLDYTFATRQRKNLLDMQESIRILNRDYTWTPYQGSITLIRSTEMAGMPDKDWHVEHWKQLALGGVDLHVVEGIHHDLFLEPTVQVLARQVSACLAAVAPEIKAS